MTLDRPIKPARLRSVRILVLAAALAVSGCTAPPDLDSGTGAALQEQVAAVRSALAGGDPAGALTTLDTLAADVGRAATEGKISPERKTRILHAIARVRSDALAAIPPEPAAPAPAEGPDPVPSPPQQDDKRDEPKDQGKEKDGESGKGKAEEEQEKDKDKGKD